MTWQKNFLILLLAAFAWLSPFYITVSHAEDSPDNVVRQVKAAYLLKFANYIEWPRKSFETPESPVIIGVIGADRLAAELGRIAQDRLIGKRRVIIRRLSINDEAAKMHILFIGSNAGDRLGKWLGSNTEQPLLTVTDASNSLAHMSAIKFVLDDNRLRFDVSVPAAERNRIKITAPLLTVARNIEK